MLEAPPKKRRSGRSFLLFFIALLLGGIGYILYQYGNDAKEYLFDAPEITLVKGRIDQYEARLQEGKTGSKNLYAFLADARSTLESLEARYPADPRVPYSHGLFDFYELLLRVPLNSENLLLLTGRGYLPGARSGYSERSIEELGASSSSRMRKTLALSPSFPEADVAKLAIVYGDLFSLGRTDPFMSDLVASIDGSKVPSRFQKPYLWISLVLNTILGNPEAVSKKLEETDTPALDLSPSQKKLLLAHSHFFSGNFLQSLRLVRAIKYDPIVPVEDRVEAARIEGEIFLIQRGPAVALYFFHEALAISGGKDPFIQERIERIRLDLQP